MTLTEEEKKTKIEEVRKNLNQIFVKTPYLAVISTLEDYASVTDTKVQGKTWGFRITGNVDLNKDPYPKINMLIRGFISNVNQLLGPMMGSVSVENEKK